MILDVSNRGRNSSAGIYSCLFWNCWKYPRHYTTRAITNTLHEAEEIVKRAMGLWCVGGMNFTLVVEVQHVEAKRLPDSSVLQVVFAPVAGVGSREGMTGSGRRPGRLLELLVMEVAETAEELQPLAVIQLLLMPPRSRRSQTGRKSRSKRWLWRDIPHRKTRTEMLLLRSWWAPGIKQSC